jgi:hypothetical protein
VAPALAAGNEVFIKALNDQLSSFAASSEMDIRYENVSYVSDPMLDSYYAVTAPQLRFTALGLTYTFTARRIALVNEDKGIWSVAMPQTMQMVVTGSDPQQPGDRYAIRLRGIPKLMLKISPTGKVTQWSVQLPEGSKPEVSRSVDGRDISAQLDYAAKPLHQPVWMKPGNRMSLSGLRQVAMDVCESLNTQIEGDYPGYIADGCGWRPR